MQPIHFVDIHCHLIPGIDDGSKSLEESLEMARIAVEDGIAAIIVTPHQLGAFSHNQGDTIRDATASLQAALDANQIPLQVAPGADVRIEDGMLQGLRSRTVVSLADLGHHVLLELPHELYMDLRPLLTQLKHLPMQGILSHPERNHGLLARPHLVEELVEQGCLVQVTAGSLLGTFGPASQAMAESLVRDGLVHFLATDAHGSRGRRPLLRRAYIRAAELTSQRYAAEICCQNPLAVWEGEAIPPGRREVAAPAKSWFAAWGASKKPSLTPLR